MEFFGAGAQPKSVKTFFVWVFCCRAPDFGRNTTSTFGEDLFVMEIT